MKIKCKFICFAIILLLPIDAMSHRGKTDSSGGHYNRKTGEYHNHNSGKSSYSANLQTDSQSVIDSKNDALKIKINTLYSKPLTMQLKHEGKVNIREFSVESDSKGYILIYKTEYGKESFTALEDIESISNVSKIELEK